MKQTGSEARLSRRLAADRGNRVQGQQLDSDAAARTRKALQSSGCGDGPRVDRDVPVTARAARRRSRGVGFRGTAEPVCSAEDSELASGSEVFELNLQARRS
eukprot:1178936-Rhodomonas_salina.1